jgi:hypothetical protein
MKRILHSGFTLIFLIGFYANAQNIVWTGNAANNDFFDEGNWKNATTNTVLASGALNPGVAINLPLKVSKSATAITANGIINLGTGSLEIDASTVAAPSLSSGIVTIAEGGYINLSDASPLANNVQINFTSGIGWIRTANYKGSAVLSNNLAQIKVNNNAAIFQTNLRLDNYYANGCVIRANIGTTAPLTVFDGINSLGNPALIAINTIHSGSTIAGGMNNKIKSFVLKRGFMVTFAVEEDGTGKSINYIASEDDLIINTLPKTLLNSISFIRVSPWNWVTKKGITDLKPNGIDEIETNLNPTWVYNWGSNLTSTTDVEYAPMSWMYTGADDAADINLYVNKYNSTHVMGFNEPDACEGQSGQYPSGPTPLKLCNPDIAVKYYKNLMKTGMRLVSPGCREEGANDNGWLEQFITKAKAQDVRVDAIAVHWYDWGSDPKVNVNHTATQIFNRFKSYITKVYEVHKLPIWITEFNANPARSNAVNAAFLNLALPWLESVSYVERYVWFPYDTNTHYYGYDDLTETQTNTTNTAVGTSYKNHVSSPSIPVSALNASSNLNVTNCICQ